MVLFAPDPTIGGKPGRTAPPRLNSRSISPATQFSSTPGWIARAAACCAATVAAMARSM